MIRNVLRDVPFIRNRHRNWLMTCTL